MNPTSSFSISKTSIPAQPIDVTSITVANGMENIDELAWKEFVEDHPEGNFFQSPEFYRFAAKVHGYKPIVVGAFFPDGRLAGILTGVIQCEPGFLKSFFSSRFVAWGGPLVAPLDSPLLATLLLKEVIRLTRRRAIYAEIRNLADRRAWHLNFSKLAFSYQPYVNVLVSASDRNLAWQGLQSGKRRQIKKTLDAGVQVESNPDLDQVYEFYQLLSNRYRTKVHKPLPHWSFFRSFHESPGLGRFLLLIYQGEVIGGIMCPVFKNQILYEWYVAGDDGRIKGIYPSVLATWAAISYALDQHFSHFDFLGAGRADQDYGVRQFKMAFGGQEVAYGRYLRINNPLLYRLGKTILRWKAAIMG